MYSVFPFLHLSFPLYFPSLPTYYMSPMYVAADLLYLNTAPLFHYTSASGYICQSGDKWSEGAGIVKMLQYSTLDLTGSTHDLAVAAVSPDMNTSAACIRSHLQALGGLLFHYRSVFIPFVYFYFAPDLVYFTSVLKSVSPTQGCRTPSPTPLFDTE
jgi:hypothetical protein